MYNIYMNILFTNYFLLDIFLILLIYNLYLILNNTYLY